MGSAGARGSIIRCNPGAVAGVNVGAMRSAVRGLFRRGESVLLAMFRVGMAVICILKYKFTFIK